MESAEEERKRWLTEWSELPVETSLPPGRVMAIPSEDGTMSTHVVQSNAPKEPPSEANLMLRHTVGGLLIAEQSAPVAAAAPTFSHAPERWVCRRGGGGGAPALRQLHVPRADASSDAVPAGDISRFALSAAERLQQERTANPFSQPKEDVLQTREKALRARKLDLERNKQLPISEKKPPSQYQATSLATVNSLRSAQTSLLQPETASGTALPNRTGGGLVGALVHAAVADLQEPALFNSRRRREKEQMGDFIARKREMFLLQMALQSRRQEIDKLNSQAAAKEKTLRDSEELLEADSIKFDAFLKANDKKAHEALQQAEKVTKERQEKLTEQKKLRAEIAKVEAEIAVYDDNLAQFLEYRDFLWKATPNEAKEQILEARKVRKAQRAAAALAEAEQSKSRAEAASLQSSGGPAATPNNQALRGPVTNHRRNTSGSAALVTRSRDTSPKTRSAFFAQPLPAPEEAPKTAPPATQAVESDDDAHGMEDSYFKEPNDLLAILSQIEQRNLFLMQNNQDMEETLEELKQRHHAALEDLNLKTSEVEKSIAELERKIEEQHAMTRHLREKRGAQEASSEQRKLLAEVSNKVKWVYAQAGFDADTQPDTLEMLRDVELTLDGLLAQLKSMDKAAVQQLEQKKENERRGQLRLARKEKERLDVEGRRHKAAQRANTEVRRRTGKIQMVRSIPSAKKHTPAQAETVDDNWEDEKQFFS